MLQLFFFLPVVHLPVLPNSKYLAPLDDSANLSPVSDTEKKPINWAFFLTAAGKFFLQPPSWPVSWLLRHTVFPKQNSRPASEKKAST